MHEVFEDQPQLPVEFGRTHIVGQEDSKKNMNIEEHLQNDRGERGKP